MSCQPWESGTPGRADPSKRGDPPRSEGPATCVSLHCRPVPAFPSARGSFWNTLLRLKERLAVGPSPAKASQVPSLAPASSPAP